MNFLSMMTDDEKREIRTNLFASEEFFSGLATGLARAGLSRHGDTQAVDRIIHPKITIEQRQLNQLLDAAKKAQTICGQASHHATNGSNGNLFGAHANFVCNSLRIAIEKIEMNYSMGE